MSRTLALVLLTACGGPDPAASTADLVSAVPPGTWAFVTTDVVVDDCDGLALFDQELREIGEGPTLTDLRGGQPIACTLSADALDCGPGSQDLLFWPDLAEELTLEATVGDGTLTGSLARTLQCLGACGDVPLPCTQVLDVQARLFTSPTELEPTDCALETSIASIASEVQTRFEVVNARATELRVHWLDHDGERAPGEAVAPGETWTAGATFVGHPFLVADADGNCVTILEPVEDFGSFTVL